MNKLPRTLLNEIIEKYMSDNNIWKITITKPGRWTSFDEKSPHRGYSWDAEYEIEKVT